MPTKGRTATHGPNPGPPKEVTDMNKNKNKKRAVDKRAIIQAVPRFNIFKIFTPRNP